MWSGEIIGWYEQTKSDRTTNDLPDRFSSMLIGFLDTRSHLRPADGSAGEVSRMPCPWFYLVDDVCIH